MAGQRYSDPFKEQALALVARQDKPASVVARELGIPRKTLSKWMEAARQHPTQPFVGSGHLRADDQRVRDLERQVRDLREANAILKKRRASSPTARSQGPVHEEPPLPRLGHDEVSGVARLPKRV